MHVRCPHCHNPIDVVDDDLWDDLTCPSCGSHFNLISDGTTVSYQGKVKSVGRFELLQQVGIGHSGSVWKARDPELDRTVAVKIPRKGHLESAERELFFREARAAAQLRHPNIVSVHEVGRDEDDTIYIVSDFVDGANLKEWLSGQQLTSREAAELIVQIAEAVHHAHESGVIHRDLKPSNVMLDVSGQPYVTDFGLARREAGEITMTVDGHILGTPAYMSPEQARGEGHTADRRSDVYSLGVILFELLTGELPFRGDQRMLILQVVNDEPPNPRKLNSRIHKDLETICLKCLQKDPGRRYPTCKELSDDLTCYLKGEPIAARPVGRTERAWRWAKRNPVVASLSGAVVLALVAGTAVSTWQAVRATYAERATEQQNYYRTIALAEMRIKNGEFQGVDQMLMSVKEEYRHWEWQYLRDQLTLEDARVVAHDDGIEQLAVSPDGKWIATAGRDKSVVALWNAATFEERHRWSKFGKIDRSISGLAFSPDGTYLAVGLFNTEVFTCSLPDGIPTKRCRIQNQNHQLRQLLLNPDGKTLYMTTGAWALHAYDTETWKERGAVPVDGAKIVHAMSPDGKLIASVGWEGGVIVRDAATLQPIWLRPAKVHQYSVAFDQTGTRFLTGKFNGALDVWSIKEAEPVLTVKPWATNETSFVRVHPDNRFYLAANREGAALLIDPNSGQEEGRLINGEPLAEIVFSPDGDHIFTASQGGTLKRWRLDRLLSYRHRTAPEKFVFKGAVGLQRLLDEQGTYGFGLAYSQDGKYLAVFESRPNIPWQITVRRAETLEPLRDVTLEEREANVGGVGRFVVFHPQTNELVVPRKGTIEFLNVHSGEQTKSFRIGGRPHSGTFDATGDRLVLASSNEGVTLLDLTSGKKRYLANASRPGWYSVDITPDGTIVAAACPDTEFVNVWKAGDGTLLHTFDTGSPGNHGIVIHAEERVLAVAGGDSLIRLYDIEEGTLLRTLRGHVGRVTSVSFSPDGERLLSSGHDQTARLWDWRSGQLVLTLNNANYFASRAAFSPNGKDIAVTDWNPSVWVRRVAK